MSIVACLAALSACVSSRALAQDATASVAARALFQEGVQLAETDQWEAAADRFHRAIALRDSPVIAYNLGTTLVHLGHAVEAAECFRRVARDPSADAAMRANAADDLAEVEPTIAWLTIRIAGASGTSHATLDGQPIHAALIDSAVPIDPGSHAIALVDEHATVVATETITLDPGERRELALEGPPIPSEPEPLVAPPVLSAPVPEPAPPPRDDTWLWVAVGSGIGAVVIAGLVVTIVLVSSSSPSPWSGNAGIVEARP